MRVWVCGRDPAERAWAIERLRLAFSVAESVEIVEREANGGAEVAPAPDLVVLIDEVVPDFAACSPGTPAVWIVGAEREDAAVHLLEQGSVSDYVLREHPARLRAVVRGFLERARLAARCAELEHQAGLADRGRELVEANRFLQALLGTAPIGVAVVSGSERRYDLFNPAFRAIFMEDEAQDGIAERMQAEAFSHRVSQTELMRWLDDVFATGTPVSIRAHPFSLSPMRGDVYLDLDFAPLFGEDGKAERALILAHDVTAGVIARREIEAERARLAAVLGQMPSGVVVIDAATGRVELANEQAAKIWHRSFDDAGGMTDYVAYHGYHPDGRTYESAEWAAARSLRTGEAVMGEEMVIEHDDGTRGVVLVSSIALRDAGGQISSVVVVLNDITARRDVEDALRSSEARYRRLFLEHRSPMLLIDPGTGQITDANPAATSFYGYPLEVLTAMKITQLNVLTDRVVFDHMQHAVAERGFFEFQHRLANGEVRDVEVFTSPIDFDGRVLLHSIVHDVTERRQVREALRDAHDQLDAVFRSITDAVVIFDVNGEPVRVNPAADRLLDVGPWHDSDERHRPHSAVWWPDGRRVVPEDLPSRRALRGETVTGEELKVIDGRGRERWIVASAAPLRHGNRAMGAVLVWYDITERRRLITEAQRRAAELDAVFESIEAAVLLHNSDGSLSRVNRRAVELLGYSPEQQAQPLAERIAELDILTVDGGAFAPGDLPVSRVLRGEGAASSLMRIRLPRNASGASQETNARWIWMLANAGPVRDADGELAGAVTVLSDVTAQQELLERAARQAAELRATVSAIADAVVIYGPAGEIREMNQTARRLLGYDAETQGRPLGERLRTMAVRSRDGEPFTAQTSPMGRALQGETVRSVLMAQRHPTRDATVWVAASAAPIVIEGGRVLGAVATFSDVTHFLEVQEALEEANVALEEVNAALGEANAALEERAVELTEQAQELEAKTEQLQVQNLELVRLAELAESKEARLQAILDALPVGVFIADARGRLVEINDRAYEIWGRQAHRASSSEEYAAYRGWWADTGEPLVAADWALARALDHGDTATGEMIDIVRFDGRCGTILNSAAPIYDRENHRIGAVAITQDITEWRAAETALAERTRQLEVLNRVSRTLVGSPMMEDVLGAVLRELCDLFGASASAAWLAGEGPAGSRGEKERGLLCACIEEGVGEATEHPGPLDELWLTKGQGLAGWVMATGLSRAISDAPTNPNYRDAVDGLLGVRMQSVLAVPLKVRSDVIGVLEIYDTTVREFDTSQQVLAESIAAATAVAVERAQLYDQARRDADVRATLLREVNHRVKNNLSAILGLISAERRRPGVREDDVCRDVLDDLSNRVHSLVSAHTMLSAGGWAEVKLASLVDRVIASSATVMRGSGASGRNGLSLNVTQSPVMVTAEQAHHLALVINELVTNTAKHGHGDGGVVIEVSIERDSDEVRLVFRDHGPGYPAEVLAGAGWSVGLGLVDTIVRLSLRGQWTPYNDGGAVTEVRFPEHSKQSAKETYETKG